jgi:NodT family efflux transporter outer membrane factor (OMF) lipoprotein
MDTAMKTHPLDTHQSFDPRAVVRTVALACMAVLSACVTAPDSPVPKQTVVVPERFDAVPAAASAPVVTPMPPLVLERWWESVQDPVLTQLIQRGLSSNSDVRVAQDKLRETRAYQTVAQSAMYPSIEAIGGAGREHNNTRGPGIVPDIPWPLMGGATGGLVAAWELDVLGGRRSDAQAVEEGAQAAQEQVYGTQLMVSGDIASNYFEARGIEQRLALLYRGIHVAQRTFNYAEGRFKAGQTSHAEVDRAQSQVDYASSQVEPLKALLEVRLHRLAVLTGQLPQALKSLPPLPATSRLPSRLPQVLPSEVLERRPDVRGAAHMLRSQAAQLGSSRADLLPKFYLAFAAGGQVVKSDLLPDAEGDIQAIGLGVRLPIFNAGRLRAKIVMNEAKLDASAAQYERSILQALEDVENAYGGRQALDQREVKLADAVRMTQHSAEHLETAYLSGQGLLLAVLEAQATALQREDELVQTRTLKATTTVLLYKALGGGWSPSEDAKPGNAVKAP